MKLVKKLSSLGLLTLSFIYSKSDLLKNDTTPLLVAMNSALQKTRSSQKVKLPSPTPTDCNTIKLRKEAVEATLAELNLNHFMEKTTIIKSLTEHELHPLGVVMAFELALHDYRKNLLKECTYASPCYQQGQTIVRLLLMNRDLIIEQILRDNLPAINCLKQNLTQDKGK